MSVKTKWIVGAAAVLVVVAWMKQSQAAQAQAAVSTSAINAIGSVN